MPVLPRRLRRTTKVLRMVHERRRRTTDDTPRAAGLPGFMSFF